MRGRKKKMNRKQFLKTSLRAGLCCCGAVLGLQGEGQESNQGLRSGQALSSDLGKRIREGAESPPWRKMEKTESWIKSLFDNMDALLDEETKTKLMNSCGRSCFHHAYGVADDRKPSPERAEEYLRALEKAGAEVQRDGRTITVFYRWGTTKQNPWGLSIQEGHCLCPIVESRVPGLSPTYCNCSAGYVKEGFERATGWTVTKVEILESVLRGGKDCRFKIILAT